MLQARSSPASHQLHGRTIRFRFPWAETDTEAVQRKDVRNECACLFHLSDPFPSLSNNREHRSVHVVDIVQSLPSQRAFTELVLRSIDVDPIREPSVFQGLPGTFEHLRESRTEDQIRRKRPSKGA